MHFLKEGSLEGWVAKQNLDSRGGDLSKGGKQLSHRSDMDKNSWGRERQKSIWGKRYRSSYKSNKKPWYRVR